MYLLVRRSGVDRGRRRARSCYQRPGPMSRKNWQKVMNASSASTKTHDDVYHHLLGSFKTRHGANLPFPGLLLQLLDHSSRARSASALVRGLLCSKEFLLPDLIELAASNTLGNVKACVSASACNAVRRSCCRFCSRRCDVVAVASAVLVW